MGKNGTNAAARGAAVLCAFAAAACSGEGPDPRAIARRLFDAPPARSEDRGPMPVVASFAPFDAPGAQPAPAGETRPQVLPQHRATMLVGHHAADAMDTPLGRAFAAAGAGHDLAPMPCPDRDAIEQMMQGRADFAVIGGNLSVRDQQAGLRQTRLGVELFALAVAAPSPVRSLTSSQVRKVLTGEVRSWNELGYAGGAVVVYVPADGGRRERAAKVLIPGDALATSCIATDDDQLPQVLGNPGALGVVRVGAEPPGDGVRLLQIDWSAPTLDAFVFGAYPFAMPVTLVTAGQPAGVAGDFLAFARSPQGSTLLRRSLLPTP